MTPQVTGAATYLHQIGALEASDIDSTITPLAYLIAGLGLDLPIARMVVLGVILDCAVEALVFAACICQPQVGEKKPVSRITAWLVIIVLMSCSMAFPTGYLLDAPPCCSQIACRLLEAFA